MTKEHVHFSVCLGNPPYNDESKAVERNYAPPVYHLFLDQAYKIAEVAEFIHPARFLFDAGSTPQKWNNRMLNDPHFKVLQYESDSNNIFPGLPSPIKGGIAITIRSCKQNYGAIQAFSIYPQLNTILHKVTGNSNFKSIDSIVYSRTSYRLTKTMHQDYPEALSLLSKGHPYDLSSNIFQRLPFIFHEEIPTDGKKYSRVIGRDESSRTSKFIRTEYITEGNNLNDWKVYVPQAFGSGKFGETLGIPVVEGPNVAATETYISFGKFSDDSQAKNMSKYLYTKFLRTLLGVLKVTQNGNKPVWRFVPTQNFSNKSDIDWSASIPEIDRQLYKKYHLSSEEIEFIETHVKGME